ncbi:hypothetical protein IMY05_010G0066100 [Salix suchowensis]|nr:hypothetical protein IMY05_010G0066100 [Salix suchowensis]
MARPRGCAMQSSRTETGGGEGERERGAKSRVVVIYKAGEMEREKGGMAEGLTHQAFYTVVGVYCCDISIKAINLLGFVQGTDRLQVVVLSAGYLIREVVLSPSL